jgi:hypothetical protein
MTWSTTLSQPHSQAARLSRHGPAIAYRASILRTVLPFAPIASSDLDIAVARKLVATKLPLGDEFEPSRVKVVGFQTPLRCRGLIEEVLEDASGHAHGALILAHADAELDG